MSCFVIRCICGVCFDVKFVALFGSHARNFELCDSTHFVVCVRPVGYINAALLFCFRSVSPLQFKLHIVGSFWFLRLHVLHCGFVIWFGWVSVLFRLVAMTDLNVAAGSGLLSLYVLRVTSMGLKLHNVQCVFRFVMLGFRCVPFGLHSCMV